MARAKSRVEKTETQSKLERKEKVQEPLKLEKSDFNPKCLVNIEAISSQYSRSLKVHKATLKNLSFCKYEKSSFKECCEIF